MSRPNPSLPLWLAFTATLAAMLWSAQLGERLALTGAAAAFALFAAYSAHRVAEKGLSDSKGPASGAIPCAMSELSSISALVYAWGGTALIAIYRFTPLHWQHGWQYGSAMLLIASGLAAYAGLLARPGSSLAGPPAITRIAQLSALQGVGTIGALVWLISSVKLASTKGDWAANAIFIAGGIAIVWLSFLAVRLHRRCRAQLA